MEDLDKGGMFRKSILPLRVQSKRAGEGENVSLKKNISF